MFAHTQKLMDALRDEAGDAPELPELDEGAEPVAPDDPRYLQLQMRRRHMNKLIKQMLEQSGYRELARMSSMRNAPAPDYDNEEAS